jgi:hypothetical protein
MLRFKFNINSKQAKQEYIFSSLSDLNSDRQKSDKKKPGISGQEILAS